MTIIFLGLSFTGYRYDSRNQNAAQCYFGFFVTFVGSEFSNFFENAVLDTVYLNLQNNKITCCSWILFHYMSSLENCDTHFIQTPIYCVLCSISYAILL